MGEVLQDQLHALDPGALVRLYELDVDVIAPGAGSVYWHSYPGENDGGGDIVFQGVTYAQWPIEVGTIDISPSGAHSRPNVVLGNENGLISDLLAQYDDLVGAHIIRRTTFASYLDAGASPDPIAEYPPELFVVDRKVADTTAFVQLELAAMIDVQGVMIPGRIMQSSVCPWAYRGTECGYAGPEVDDDDQEEDVYTVILSGQSGTFIRGETLDFSGGGTARFSHQVSTVIWYKLLTGSPASAETVTGASSGATGTLATTPAEAYDGTDTCPKLLGNCKARHGAEGPLVDQSRAESDLRFGAFPGTTRLPTVGPR